MRAAANPVGRSGCGNRRGFVLVAVLIVIMLASMVAISLLFRLKAEATATAAGAGSEQAWAAAMSGLQEAIRVAGASVPGALEWQDDPATFRDRLVADDGLEQWFFTVFAAGETDGAELRYGLTDEAGKLNLNVNLTNETALTALPGMTTYLAQGLLDFLDADNTPRPEGAEQEYYDTLANPYTARNGPLVSLDELLLVRGFTPAVVYGEDANLNCALDPNEDDAEAQFPLDNKDGKLERGVRPFLTVYSYDLNLDGDGLPRIDLNNEQESLGDKNFPAALVQYIEAMRKNKTTIAHPAELLEAKGKFKNEQGQEVELASGVGKTELPVLLESFTATADYELPGLVNINTASAGVLRSLLEVDEALAANIVNARSGLQAEQRRTPAWLYTEDLVDAQKFKQLAPRLTARSWQFHVQVVGYGVPSGRYRVLEAVVDVAGAEPAILYLRDVTRLGLPFRIGTTLMDELAVRGSREHRSPAGLRARARGELQMTRGTRVQEVPHG